MFRGERKHGWKLSPLHECRRTVESAQIRMVVEDIVQQRNIAITAEYLGVCFYQFVIEVVHELVTCIATDGADDGGDLGVRESFVYFGGAMKGGLLESAGGGQWSVDYFHFVAKR